MRRIALPALLLTAALAGCGASSGPGQLSSDVGAQSPAVQGPESTGGVGAACTAQPATSAGVAGTSDLSKKPQIEVPDGPPPCNLVIGDIVQGRGPAAKPGDPLTMKYVGVTYASGKQFDASWDRGQDFPFTLGGGQVIAGWDQGLVGMKVGGRRQLIIPPALGYGATGQDPIPPNATLIFVVDLVKIG